MSTPKLFPLQGPIRPEERQIGRRPAIDGLYRQCVGQEQPTLLLEERRVGKTSMALAVLDRVRNNDAGWAIECDLSRGPIRSCGELADHLAEQARAGRVRIDSSATVAKRFAKKVKDAIPASHLKAAAKALGVQELREAAQIASFVDQSLAPLEEERLEIRSVLAAIQAAAMVGNRPAVIFLDEVQRLATNWVNDEDGRRAQEALAEVMEDPEGRIVLLLAGSERSAVEALLAPGMPLHHDGMQYGVPEIDPADWHHELPERFAEARLEIGPERVSQILEASNCHPQRTMRVCAHIERLAAGGPFEISDVLVAEAIKEAEEHPSWSG